MATGVDPGPGMYRLTDSNNTSLDMTVIVDASTASCICADMEKRDGGPSLGVVYTMDGGAPVLVFYEDGSYALVMADGKTTHGSYAAVP